MKVWPFGVGLRGRASNHPELRWLKTVVVSVREKAHVMRQVGTRKTYQKRPVGVTWLGVVVEASKSWDGTETGGPSLPLGVSLVCCSCTEREKASVDMAAVSGPVWPSGRERERAEAETVGTEYRCGVR